MKQNAISALVFCITMLFPWLGTTTVSANEVDTVFVEDFNSEEDFNQWESINPSEETTKTWIYYSTKGNGQARILKESSVAHDNWLISPLFNLEEGKVYELSCYIYSGVYNKQERLKVTLGSARNVEAQTTNLIDLVDFVRGDATHYDQRFSVDATGEYAIGLYAYSQANQGRIEVDSICIKELSMGSVPDSVSGLTATAAEAGLLKATISFTTPSTTSKGDALSSLSSVKISRNGEEIHTFTDVTPGTYMEYTDEEALQGYNTYEVSAANGDGEGEAKATMVYVGLDVPQNVKHLTAHRNSDLSISLQWNKPTASVHGGYYDEASLQYAIILDGDTLAKTAETEYTFTPSETALRSYSFSVAPIATLGCGTDTLSNNVISGTPLTATYAEHFAAGKVVACGWVTDTAVSINPWEITTTDDTGVETPDEDGYMLMADTYYAFDGEPSRAMSPLFDLKDMQNPVFSFSLYQRKADDADLYGTSRDSVMLQVSVDGGAWQNVNNGRFSPYTDGASGWTTCQVPLLSYAGHNVQYALNVKLDSDNGSHHYIFVDNIAIAEAGFGQNVGISSFVADKKRVSIGEDTRFSVEVFNNGNASATGYDVVLYRDGKEEQRLSDCTTEPTESSVYTFTVTSTLADSRLEGAAWSAAVEYASDEVAADNTSDTLTWSVRKNEVEIPLNLQAEQSGDAIKLSWSECASKDAVTTEAAEPFTDDFESYEPFIIDNIGDWTVVDRDGGATLNSPVIPVDYAHKGEPMAWQIFNTTEAGVVTEDHYDNVFLSKSGVQYIMCTSNDDYYKANDDWLISPRLDGKAQTISFFARTPNAASGADWLKVYYSTTDKNPDSFVEVDPGSHIAVWDWWNSDAYAYDLPEGARYFAIRCVRCYLYCMVDDVTYSPYNGEEPAQTLVGYNVYRDGKKINDDPVTEVTFTDNDVEKEQNVTYNVTAVYEEGESDYSNDASAIVTRLSGASTATPSSVSAAYTVGGTRSTSSSKGLRIEKMSDGTTRKVVIK